MRAVDVPRHDGERRRPSLGGEARFALEVTYGWEWLAELVEHDGRELHLAYPLRTKAIASQRPSGPASCAGAPAGARGGWLSSRGARPHSTMHQVLCARLLAPGALPAPAVDVSDRGFEVAQDACDEPQVFDDPGMEGRGWFVFGLGP